MLQLTDSTTAVGIQQTVVQEFSTITDAVRTMFNRSIRLAKFASLYDFIFLEICSIHFCAKFATVFLKIGMEQNERFFNIVTYE